jgi:hypothetical protein
MRNPSPTVTTDDVVAVLKTKGLAAAAVEWLRPIDEHQQEQEQEHRNQVHPSARSGRAHRGALALRAAALRAQPRLPAGAPRAPPPANLNWC